MTAFGLNFYHKCLFLFILHNVTLHVACYYTASETISSASQVNWILPGLFFPLNGNVCPTDGIKKKSQQNLRDPRKLKQEAFYHARTLAANVTNGNQISHSLSRSTDCCNYIKFRTGVGCRMWQEIQVKKCLFAPAFTAFAVLYPPPVPILLFL